MNKNKELLQTLQKEYSWQKVSIGESGAETYYLTGENKPSYYLKISPIQLMLNLEKESKVLKWLKKRLPVPELVTFFIDEDKEHLLMSELPGAHMAEAVTNDNKAELVRLLAFGLKLIHNVSVKNCPFSHTINEEIERAKDRIKHCLVNENDFDEVRWGRKASDLLEELIKKAPPKEDLVFTHGDYCLPNIIVTEERQLSGFIDLSRAGIGDRYRDLALACRSIEYNYGKEWITLFVREYGYNTLAQEKIEFYQLLDEFF